MDDEFFSNFSLPLVLFILLPRKGNKARERNNGRRKRRCLHIGSSYEYRNHSIFFFLIKISNMNVEDIRFIFFSTFHLRIIFCKCVCCICNNWYLSLFFSICFAFRYFFAQTHIKHKINTSFWLEAERRQMMKMMIMRK